jgi:tetratricopeptide (TPR) repeat protein
MAESRARLHKAAALYRQGRLADAERLCRAVLRAAPEDGDALFMLGNLALSQGRVEQAAPLLERAVRRKSLQPEFHVSLGNVRVAQQRPDEAESCYRQALALRPDYPEVRLNLGNVLAESGRREAALAEYDAALARLPQLAPARLGRVRVLLGLGRPAEARAEAGRLLAQQPASAEALWLRARAAAEAGDAAAAEADLREAQALAPDHFAALGDLGVLLERRGAVQEAESLYRRALELQPSSPEALRNLARRQLERGDWREAGRLWSRLLRLRPLDEQAQLNTAFCLQRVGKPKLAAEQYERLLARRPGDLQARNNLASCLLAQGRHAEAEAGYRALLGAAPGSVDTLHNLGRAVMAAGRLDEAEGLLRGAQAQRSTDARLAESVGDLVRLQGRAEEALGWYRQALAIDPGLLAAEGSLAYTALTCGEFEEGWRLQRRTRARDERWRQQLARFPQPEWQGEPLEGKRLLVWAEQGLGDHIMFVSCLPDLLGRGASVVLQTHERLAPLFARSFPQIEVHAHAGWTPAPRLLQPDIDYQCGMSALPWFTRQDSAAFPAHRGYLQPDPARVARWKARLAGLGEGRRIGVSWRGGTEGTGKARRSMALGAWRELLGRPGTQWVSLQYGSVKEELDALGREHGIRLQHWQEAAADMEEHAALIASLDLVVSVCNTAIHMAGAVGTPVWVLVPARAGWRYLQRGERMPWYPSARLFRQSVPGRWDDVLGQVGQALRAPAP